MNPAPPSPWPDRLWLVRHGQSAGNVANEAALLSGQAAIDIAERDMDVPLSPLGERQADALGAWFAQRPEAERPNVILASPYVRAMQTADRIAAVQPPLERPLVRVHDERLREKELGELDRLTKAGILARYPEEADRRARVGKFYYRPPSGESWCDVILRLRSMVDHIQLQHRGERVLVVAHQVIVLCFRYLLEHLTEAEILAIDGEKDVANCSVTSYALGRDEANRTALRLEAYNFCTPIEEAGEAVTKAADPPAPR